MKMAAIVTNAHKGSILKIGAPDKGCIKNLAPTFIFAAPGAGPELLIDEVELFQSVDDSATCFRADRSERQTHRRSEPWTQKR